MQSIPIVWHGIHLIQSAFFLRKLTMHMSPAGIAGIAQRKQMLATSG